MMTSWYGDPPYWPLVRETTDHRWSSLKCHLCWALVLFFILGWTTRFHINLNNPLNKQYRYRWYDELWHSRVLIMMTSSNGNIFRVTGPLCGEFTGPGEFPTQRPVTRSFDVFFDLRPNKKLSKQPWGWWFETQSWLLWRHCNDVGWIYPWCCGEYQSMPNCNRAEQSLNCLKNAWYMLLKRSPLPGLISFHWVSE